MKLIRIFADLYALEIENPKYPDAPKDALSQTLAYWKDTDAVEDFFLRNYEFLQDPYFKKQGLFEGDREDVALSAALLVQKQAIEIEILLLKRLRSGTLDRIFRFLYNNQYVYKGLDLHKTKNGVTKPLWLRIYAIRIEGECYVITCGGIKLTEEMKDHENTLHALNVINKVKTRLIEEGVNNEEAIHEAQLS